MHIGKGRALDYMKHEWDVRPTVPKLASDVFFNGDIEGWLVDDVVKHYDEYPIPG